MEGVIPDVFQKVVGVFDKGTDENNGLNYDERVEIARFYMEYLAENC